jgi:hypothetical protein
MRHNRSNPGDARRPKWAVEATACECLAAEQSGLGVA